jgi:hypothetical protein
LQERSGCCCLHVISPRGPSFFSAAVAKTDGRTDSEMRDFPDPCMTQCYQCIFYTVLFITTTYGLELAQLGRMPLGPNL